MAQLTPVNLTDLQPTVLTEFTFDTSSSGDKYKGSRRMVLLAYNSSTDTAYDITITSQPDAKNRTANIVEEIAFGVRKAFIFESDGWLDSGNDLNVSGENAAIKYKLFNAPK